MGSSNDREQRPRSGGDNSAERIEFKVLRQACAPALSRPSPEPVASCVACRQVRACQRNPDRPSADKEEKLMAPIGLPGRRNR